MADQGRGTSSECCWHCTVEPGDECPNAHSRPCRRCTEASGRGTSPDEVPPEDFVAALPESNRRTITGRVAGRSASSVPPGPCPCGSGVTRVGCIMSGLHKTGRVLPPEKEQADAPIHYGASEADAWVAGYNAALADVERVTAPASTLSSSHIDDQRYPNGESS